MQASKQCNIFQTNCTLHWQPIQYHWNPPDFQCSDFYHSWYGLSPVFSTYHWKDVYSVPQLQWHN